MLFAIISLASVSVMVQESMAFIGVHVTTILMKESKLFGNNTCAQILRLKV